MTIVIPTLASDPSLRDCLSALMRQTYSNFVAVVADNSGRGSARRFLIDDARIRCVTNDRNLGFGEAINKGFEAHPSEYLAVLNDDAVASDHWLAALVDALDAEPRAGMAASQVRQSGSDRLDSAGLGIARDGSSKQIGHGAHASQHAQPAGALIPSGCAALYRKAMLDEVGLFEPSFFLYCEDTDLALRGHWAGWLARYVPGAVVDHRYSLSSGRASALKAYLVERNRLRVAVRCLPLGWLLAAPFASLVRYLWHVAAIFSGSGKAAEFARQGSAFELPWIVLKAHLALIRDLPGLLRQRRSIPRTIGASEFSARLKRHLIPLREVASQ